MFVVIYGINNLGKTTQAERLVERLKNESGDTRYLKYPLYKLEPSGPIIDNYLRPDEEGRKNPFRLSPREFQIVNIQNRTQFQPTLQHLLVKGIHIIAEDYTGTGLAWGIGAGVDKDFLIRLNSHLIREDIAFLFDGKRFDDGKEANHTHETDDNFTECARLAHLDLAKEFGWYVIGANRSREVIHEEIWAMVEPLLRR